jgi:hypothetical protein
MSLGGSRPNTKERTAFTNAYTAGVLSIAAAGNEGTSALSYPASYDSVMSVAAIDSNKVVADFSQFNTAVEIAAPGVAVLSTLPYLETNRATVDGVDYAGGHIEFSARGTASGALVDGGLCATAGFWSGKVVLCQRGDISFYDKVNNVKAGGGAAAIIYNNVPGDFLGTLGEGYSSTIIGISLSQEAGQYLVANKLGRTATVFSQVEQPASGYEAWDGTSMATPHVSAVAALVWSWDPTLTNAEIRNALTATAKDLGTTGRDVYYGYGLVQARAALESLGYDGGTTPPVNSAPTLTITSPANGSSFAEGTIITFAATATDVEDGSLSDAIAWKLGSVTLHTGASFTKADLEVGTHTLDVSVTDSGNLTTTKQVTVTVTQTSVEQTLVASIATDKDEYVDREKVNVTVTVKDQSGAAVASASVSVTLTSSNGTQVTYTGITGTTGEFAFSYRLNVRKTGAGTYNLLATVSKAGYISTTATDSFLVQ